MEVKRAGTAGFCMGVSLALHKLEMAIEANGSGGSALRRICTYGPIIHNPQVLASYEARGVVCLKSVDGASQSRKRLRCRSLQYHASRPYCPW